MALNRLSWTPAASIPAKKLVSCLPDSTAVKTGSPAQTAYRMSGYDITEAIKPQNQEGSLGNSVGKPQIWGCERAPARSHPQIWGTATVIPKEPPRTGQRRPTPCIRDDRTDAGAGRVFAPLPSRMEEAVSVIF